MARGWPYSSPGDRRWYLDVPDDCQDRPFRLGVRRGVLEELRLREVEPSPGSDAVLEALRSLVAMEPSGRPLLHRWVQAARSHGASWGTIGRRVGIARQTAHERFIRHAPQVPHIPSRALWVSVQVGRDRAADPTVTAAGVAWYQWTLRGWRRWGREPPRDQVDLAVLCRVLDCIQEELALLVAEARYNGMTWAALGYVLNGISRQAAHKRFAEPVVAILAKAQNGLSSD